MFVSDTSESFSRLLEAEHGHLRSKLAQVRASLRDATADAPLPQCGCRAAEALRGLRELLDRHFAREEAEGCLNEAVARCPRLSREARTILSGHAQLLRETDRLIEQTACLKANRVDRQSLFDAFEELARTLLDYETAERKLLLEAFGGSSSFDTN